MQDQVVLVFFFQAEDGIRDLVRSRGLGDVYKRQVYGWPSTGKNNFGSWLIDSLRNGKPLKLFADQWLSLIHI